MPQTQSSKKFFLSKKFIILGTAFFMLFAGAFFSINSFFSVREIRVTSNGGRQDLKSVEVLKNKNLLLININDSQNILYSANPDIKTISIEKKYPSTLDISVVFDEPLAALVVSQGFFILSSEGRILYKVHDNKTNLPKINYYQKLNYSQFSSGETIDYKDIKTALYFLRKTRDLGMQVNTIDIKGLDMIALNLDKKMILFTTEKDLNTQGYELEVVARQLKIQGKEFVALDLRFDKPVVKF